MFRRSPLCRELISGGPVQNLKGGMRGSIQPTFAADLERETVLLRQRAAALAGINDPSGSRSGHTEGEEWSYKPTLPREWVRAPLSRLSTAASRRDWFRIMQFNMMVDAWSGTSRTTPVHGVLPYVPGFTRADSTANADTFYPFDPNVDKEIPPFLQTAFRRAYLINEIRYYDPDIVCLQEVSRPFFNDALWKYVRYWGYGNLYQSSRGYRMCALRPGDDPNAPRHRGKISPTEDIGNVILFHKGRFVPILMPGKDLGQRTHFAHIVSMRDKVTNMTLNVACVQFTAGDGPEAVEMRLHEARQTAQLLDALTRNDADRSHMSNIICGDFNNTDDEEPCVQLLREHLFSTYDVVGGPRWTAWFHEDPIASAAYETYFNCNRRALAMFDKSKVAAKEIAETKKRRVKSGPNLTEHSLPWIKSTGQSQRITETLLVKEEETPTRTTTTMMVEKEEKGEKKTSGDASAREEERACVQQDALARRRQVLKESGTICRAQDFLFYDPRSLALHQVLDVPDERHIQEEQLLPNTNHPSHHIHLVVDVSFTDVSPDVGERSLKD